MNDYYDTLIGEHAGDTRCQYVHAMTESETTCPVILGLIQMQRAARPADQEAAEQ